MNLEELKTAWQIYDQKLTTSQKINEKIVYNMIRERSNFRLSRLKRENMFLIVFMFLEFIVLVAVFFGNPFDFVYLWQYIPFLFLIIGNLMAIVMLFSVYKTINMDISGINLSSFLKKIIYSYEKNKKTEGWFGAIMFVSGCLTVFSFVPKKLVHKTLPMAIIDTLIPLILCIIIYYLAFKMGVFKNQKSEAFKKDLEELEELSSELQQNGSKIDEF